MGQSYITDGNYGVCFVAGNKMNLCMTEKEQDQERCVLRQPEKRFYYLPHKKGSFFNS